MLTARVSDADADTAEALVQDAVDIGTRGAGYRQGGWTRLDDAAPPLDHARLAAGRAGHGFI